MAHLRRFVLLTFRHLGALGLFLLAVVDSSPVPTFCGPDLLVIILVASGRNPWYEYAAVAAAGALIGAYFTYRLAHKAGHDYLESKFGSSRVTAMMKVFDKWGTATLIGSTAVPFPFPTSMFFAAAGVSEYPLGRFLILVGLGRSARYATLAYLARIYGRHVIRVLLHPGEYWSWLLLATAAIFAAVGGAMLLKRRIFPSEPPGHTASAH